MSPDGTAIVFTSDRDGHFEFYLMTPTGTDIRRLTYTALDESYPMWSPDGAQIVYSQVAAGDAKTCIVGVATGQVSQITDNEVDDWAPSLSPSGDRIAFAHGRFPNDCICGMATGPSSSR